MKVTSGLRIDCLGLHVGDTGFGDIVRSAPMSDDSAGESSESTFQRLTDEWLRQDILKAAELLPGQGPITAFAFVNPLQAMEGHPFDEGLQQGSRLYGCQPYLPEGRYRRLLKEGRIRTDDLIEVLLESLGDRADQLIGRLGTRFHFQLAMLEHPLRLGSTAELKWVVAESDALTQFRPETPEAIRQSMLRSTQAWFSGDSHVDSKSPQHALRTVLHQRFGSDSTDWNESRWTRVCLNLLWMVCRQGVHQSENLHSAVHGLLRPRDILVTLVGEDSDQLVHDVLIRFCAAYLDQGQADWEMPAQGKTFWQAFHEYHSQPVRFRPRWLKRLPAILKNVQAAGHGPLDVIRQVMTAFGLSAKEVPEFLRQSILALRGWAGMIWHMESRPDRVPYPVEPDTFIQFLAVRLLLDQLAAEHFSRRLGAGNVNWNDLRQRAIRQGDSHGVLHLEQRAFLIFQLAQIRNWHPTELLSQSQQEWRVLLHEVETFSGIERRRVYHHAYERAYQARALDAIEIHAQQPLQAKPIPIFQAAFCIDAREESFRRHLEAVEPRVETFGTAGFFAVAMQFRGVASAYYSTLCPIVVKPKHWVTEDVALTEEEIHRRRASVRRTLGVASRQFQISSRSFASGALLSAGLGVLASVPLVMSVMFPRLTSRLQASARQLLAPPRLTRLRLERTAESPAPNNGGIGYNIIEMTDICRRSLQDIGLTSRFARLVFLCGHGSECLNNPHKSAYDCGACSGNPGGPNARALAAMMNDVRVRSNLAHIGIEIPITTVFIGAQHNTCNDTFEYFDLDLVPTSHLDDFRAARSALDKACELNAVERCRRFASVPKQLTPAQAHQIVRQRAEDLAETRPEYGNCTNAMCVVGRRDRTRGLFLDRRSFLMSYDPTIDDDDATILGRILGAVVPVCSGINLQYTLSRIDPAGWGCGTKLPHNVTSLLGVMDGAASDLRSGLPWQGVDIHEPMRLLFVMETTPQAIRKIMSRNEVVQRLIENRWVHLALLDPATSRITVYRNGEFQPHQSRSSQLPRVTEWSDWFIGKEENLGFVERCEEKVAQTP